MVYHRVILEEEREARRQYWRNYYAMKRLDENWMEGERMRKRVSMKGTILTFQFVANKC